MNNNIQDKEIFAEAIRSFNPPKDKIPLTFRLMRVKGLQPWANTNSVSIGDVIQVISNSAAYFLEDKQFRYFMSLAV